MRALILVGGLVTRLRDLTEMPKALLKVARKLFLGYQLDFSRRSGITEIVLCVGYKGELIHNYFGDGSRWRARLFHSFEGDRLLGMGGS